ncbi:hypothetical protein U9M48_011579 [Paspalum notatum var. saurae]|uniref:F-box domain-containing protein n=1 Tax=Paspalum notatum var. saurae TaxID=547442 RepID=A0AAQ3SVR6_PASNO
MNRKPIPVGVPAAAPAFPNSPPRRRPTMGDTRRMRRRLEEAEQDEGVDLISRLPDALLGEIVSLLPTRDGARTQVLSSRWRHLWRSAPLNFDLERRPVPVPEVTRILSSHQGPGRRFCHPAYPDPRDRSAAAAALDGWLGCPALTGLQDLVLQCALMGYNPAPLPASLLAHRFSSTLRAASFGTCDFRGAGAGALRFPVLEQLTLSFATISESSLHALLAGCPVLQSLVLAFNRGFNRVRLVSACLRSIGVHAGWSRYKLLQLVIEDAPCLERLLFLEDAPDKGLEIAVISAPRLGILGKLSDTSPILKFDTTEFQGSHLISTATVVHSVTVLALTNTNLSLDVIINFMRRFPCLEKLYIKASLAGGKNAWRRKYKDLIGTLDIRLKKIVFINYRGGNTSHVNFAKFFLLNARALESMILKLDNANPSRACIETHHRSLLQIKNKASRCAQVQFVYGIYPRWRIYDHVEQAHELSTGDPFVDFRYLI